MTSPKPSYRRIALTRGQYSIVDAADFEWLNEFNWYAKEAAPGVFYAYRSLWVSPEKRTSTPMHREILGLQPGDPRKGDHRNPAKTLDNRRRNLRIGTLSQSNMNRRIQANNLSGYKGVSKCSRAATYRARCGVNGVYHCRYGFKTPLAASRAYVKMARELHGEFARTK